MFQRFFEIKLLNGGSYLTPWVGLYSPPMFSVVSERKFARTVFPHYKKQNKTKKIQ